MNNVALDLLGSISSGAAKAGANDRDGEATAEDFTLDRALSPAEQKRVDAYQIRQADATRATEEAKGGPKAEMVVTREGATLTATPEAKPDGNRYLIAALAALGAAALAVYLWATRKRK